MLWSNLGNLGDRKGQKPNIFLETRGGKRLKVCPDCLPFIVSTRADACRLRGFRTCRRLALVLWSCVPSFRPLYCFACGVLCLNVALFRVLRAFLEGFMGFVWVCIALVLCVACVGFCARVELGGLKACCVFRLKNLFFSSSLVLLSPALLLGFLPCLLSCFLSCFLGFVAWLLVLVGLLAFFPFRTASDTKRKGTPCWCVLSCPVVG